ncbi:MAG: PKD domain-containing protein [Candidatus Gracilibacteria bacterium]
MLGLSIPTALAAGGDLAITDANVYFSTSIFVENTPVTIYAIGTSNSQSDLLGTIQFWNSTTGKQIGSDQPVSILAGSTDTVFVVWYPVGGTQTITVTLTPWTTEGDDTSNNTITRTITADYDTDGDGVGNSEDTDDDNDGSPDIEDVFPSNNAEWLDTDSDGIGNNADPDDDNDEILDEVDQMPLDYTETLDTDIDGIGNNSDTDDDGDELTDEEELTLGTDPLNPDTDSDSYSDSQDAFPFDTEEGEDFDGDKIGDNADTDDDNDGISDETDTDNHNKAPYIEVDTEGFPIKFTDQQVTLTAEDSYDEDGSIEHYEWLVNGETVSVQPIYAATFLESGNQEIDLIITDDKGESRTETVTINIHSKGFMIFLGFFILLLLLLAFYIIFKYNPRSREATSTISRFPKGNSLSSKKNNKTKSKK